MTTTTPAPGNGPTGQALQCCPFCGEMPRNDAEEAWCLNRQCTIYNQFFSLENWQRIPRMPAQALATLRREREELREALEDAAHTLSYLAIAAKAGGYLPEYRQCLSTESNARAILARTSGDSGKERE